jgi:hypothetical protein
VGGEVSFILGGFVSLSEAYREKSRYWAERYFKAALASEREGQTATAEGYLNNALIEEERYGAPLPRLGVFHAERWLESAIRCEAEGRTFHAEKYLENAIESEGMF